MVIAESTASTSSVWSAFGERLRRFIRRRIRSREDAEDVLQEVFARIHARLGTIRNPERLEAWVFRITRRSILDHRRRHAGDERVADLPDDVATAQPSGKTLAEISACLRPLMKELSKEDRAALELADMEGLRQKELAARLGLSHTGAKSRIQRARARLRDVLLACCRVEFDRRGNPILCSHRRGDVDCSCS